jgi:hypothetical protein
MASLAKETDASSSPSYQTISKLVEEKSLAFNLLMASLAKETDASSSPSYQTISKLVEEKSHHE